MRLTKILKSKRGIALENAILFMMIIFSLCALLTSLTLLGHYQVKIEKSLLLQDVKLDQIGEDYLYCISQGEEFTEVYDDYTYEVSGNALSVWHKNDATKTAVLYVEAELVGQEVNVISWRYSPREQTE